jgi:GNAT superfamily N-acetyltransferase
MPTSAAPSHVRLARPGDAPAIAAVQHAAWHTGYASLLPAAVLAARVEDLADRWASAIEQPPTPKHRILIAADIAGDAAGDIGAVRGFAAVAPEPDEPDRVAEFIALHVAPESTRHGHGSRLLTAAVEHVRADGFGLARAWILVGDDILRVFFTEAGWAPDSGHRTLDLDGSGVTIVKQIRLHTDLTEDHHAVTP